MSDRWSRLLELAEAFYEQPLSPLQPDQRGSALEEWERLTAGRYRGERALYQVSIGDIDPAERMNAPRDSVFPRWLAVAQDASGHSAWFIDPSDEREDPPVFFWDDEGNQPQPRREDLSVSDLLTWVVAYETLECDARCRDEAALGPLQADVRFVDAYGELVGAHLQEVGLAPWLVHELAPVERSADGSLYRVDGQRVVTRTPSAWLRVSDLLVAEAAAREAEERAVKRRRSAETTRILRRAGSPTDPEEQLAALERLSDQLSPLEAMFLRDFRARVRARGVLDGQRKRAAQILERYG